MSGCRGHTPTCLCLAPWPGVFLGTPRRAWLAVRVLPGQVGRATAVPPSGRRNQSLYCVPALRFFFFLLSSGCFCSRCQIRICVMRDPGSSEHSVWATVSPGISGITRPPLAICIPSLWTSSCYQKRHIHCSPVLHLP